ncbi:MAG: LPXTG cell wall anchor domain-containing protein [Candidatus Dadabacteria bacterium]|nr:MAG: LPXTG cell wall anchor domain-containing protein [Candidatus Dadabacteria bacterium]
MRRIVMQQIRRLRPLLLMLFVVAGGACIDYQETIQVNRDGSVEITVYATAVKAAMPMIRNRPELRQLMLLPAEPDKARALLGSDVDVLWWQVEDGDGIRVVDAKVRIRSIDVINRNIGRLVASDHFEVYRDDNGNWRLERRIPAYPIDPALGPARDWLSRQFADSNLEFTLRVPTRILDTNGERLDGQTVHWQTNLAKLRQQGFVMEATIEAPSQRPLLIAVGAAVLLGLAGVVFVRRRRTAEVC